MAGIPELHDLNPGLRATGFAVIVADEEVEDQRRGIYIPDSVKDKERVVQQRGRIVSMSPCAFDFADFGPDKPQVGDAIVFAKIAGFWTQGVDGKRYRILQDRDIAAVINEEPFVPIMPELLAMREEA